MLTNLLIGPPTMAGCLMLQALLLVWAVRYYLKRQSNARELGFRSALGLVTGVMLILMLGNLAQVFIWGALFRLLGEFDTLTDAVYHSAVNFATLGYGDIVMSAQHRMLGPLEAINGALMIGVSTGALSAAFQDIIRRSAVGAQHRPLAGR
jgi:hypothetical protein